MKVFRLEQMKGGCLIGDVQPAILRTECFEVACKYYKAGDHEPAHTHRVAQEVRVITSGPVAINRRRFVREDTILLEPGEPPAFEALEDTITLVVNVPSAPGDKYLVQESRSGKNDGA